jgi:hypothetical protein
MWNKDDRARQLLVDRKYQTMVLANDVDQNKNRVSESRANQNRFKLNSM